MASLSIPISKAADSFPPANGGGSGQLFAGTPRWVQHRVPHTDFHSLGSLTGSPVSTGPVQCVSAISIRLTQMIYDPACPVKPVINILICINV